jgi:hypothetical protein
MSTTNINATISVFTLPLVALPQSYNITLGNNAYIMTCKWNDADEGGWILGFADQVSGDEIVNNIPLVCGVDLLAGLDYLGFGGNLFVYTNGDATAVPTLDNLGIDCNVYFVTPAIVPPLGVSAAAVIFNGQ